MTQAVPADIVSDADLLAAKLVPLRRPGRWLTAAAALVLLAMLVHTVLTNPRFQWDVVGQYFTTAAVLHGLWLTVWLTIAVLVAGYVLGTGRSEQHGDLARVHVQVDAVEHGVRAEALAQATDPHQRCPGHERTTVPRP